MYIVLIANVIIFIVIFRVLVRNRLRRRKRLDTDETNSKTVLKVNIRLAVSIFSVSLVFGLGWILGVFIIRDAAPVFRYVFVICNTYQGFLFSILIIMIGMDGRMFWTKLFNRSSVAQSSVAKCSRNEMLMSPQSNFDRRNSIMPREKLKTTDNGPSTLFRNKDTAHTDTLMSMAAKEDVVIVVSCI